MSDGLLQGGAVAFVADALHRTWPSALHPVAWLGLGAAFLEARLHAPSASPGRQLIAGMVLVGAVVAAALVAVGVARALAAAAPLRLALDQLLTRHAIRVRDCTSFGLWRHIRVAAREGEATELAALRAEA